jgi:stage II sporulation protein D
VTRRTLALGVLLVACSTRATSRPGDPVVRATDVDAGRLVRVALVTPAPRVGGTNGAEWLANGGMIGRAERGAEWRVEREPRGARIRGVRDDGTATSWQRDFIVRASGGGYLTVNGRRYRGDVAIVPIDTGVIVVNRLPLEAYLRGVVPVEMGPRPVRDSSALQAQAVASRSYAYLRMTSETPRAFDLRASTADQVYGGLEVENAAANAAIDATRGLVLHYEGRVVDAPFSSTCGGSTAEAPEVWRSQGAPYLQRVSDRIDGSDRYYCDISPRFRWTRTLPASALNAALAQYLGSYASVPGGQPGSARGVVVRTRTASDRVAVLDVATDRGTFPLRGNDVRYVLREPGGEILPSTYFSVEQQLVDGGTLSSVTMTGRGNGHGIGMCQWGAIGRARAGQAFRTILRTYYPGTSVGPVQ